MSVTNGDSLIKDIFGLQTAAVSDRLTTQPAQEVLSVRVH